MDELTRSIREEEYDILFGVINRFIGYFTRQTVPRSSNDISHEYSFVAMDTRQAYEQIRLARDFLVNRGQVIAELSFIDIGCGIGNILLLAEMMDFQVTGIEKDTATLPIARQLLGKERIFAHDIWAFDDVATFDVIYYFRPFSSREPQVRFERLVEDQLKVGGILIANMKMDDGIDNDPRFLRLSSKMPVWCKRVA
ncbi:MAG: SAM-dependent methyltransferase [Desulfobulbus propionicus]|nr:MAG: SAM-dependent methyltransferase [Desulfobulbus propionicus]